MEDNRKIKVNAFPEPNMVFCGMYTTEPCVCCGAEDKDNLHVLHVDDNKMILCTNCLNELHEETGRALIKKEAKVN